jgi:hypothetical protein
MHTNQTREDHTMSTIATYRVASDKQINFILKLAEERREQLMQTGEYDLIVKTCRLHETPEEPQMPMEAASKLITALMERPRDERALNFSAGTPASDVVRDGYYAIDRPNDNHKNETVFYRLRTGKPGRWQGFQFIDLQAGPSWYPVKGAGARKEVYEAILHAGQENARARYGQMIGRCGCCGKPLTDDTSRQIGIGPICRDK